MERWKSAGSQLGQGISPLIAFDARVATYPFKGWLMIKA
jgi:hypothetical protein